MSMKMVQRMIEDQLEIKKQVKEDRSDINKIKKKDYKEKFDELNYNIYNLKKYISKKCNQMLEIIKHNSNSTVTVTKTTNIITEDEKDPVPTFIPEIDTSDLDIKSSDDYEEVRDINLESGLDALDCITK